MLCAINPGSTSTKIGIFKNRTKLTESIISHSVEEISSFPDVWAQYEGRLEAIKNLLSQYDYTYSAIIGRGGLLKPLSRGTYRVNHAMIQDARAGRRGQHVSNLGCALADAVAKEYGAKAFVVDPVSVDEFHDLARFSGHPLIERRALSHALNLRAAAIKAAEQLVIDIESSRFVVAHMGGGISIAALLNGRIIDVNDASSDGPFSPERTGGLPLQPFVDLCFSGKYEKQDIKKMVMGEGGLIAYLGSNDMQEIERKIEHGDQFAARVVSAMVYQICKEIGAMHSVLDNQLDAIVLTGGLAFSERVTKPICKKFETHTILIYPGQDELEAMALGALRVLTGQESVLLY
ncbi:butyrate kinase [candidate division KSB1 bacterium]|nr:butyrate kinase [candidate division KSB1 bacterium]